MLEKYLKKGMRLALAVSGGKDSMVMLDKILRLKERFNLDVRVVNVNHKIRMNGGEDSRFVADYCKKRGVKCEVYEVDVPEYAAKKKLSLETAAREMRYAVLNSAAKNSDYVCLAHHMNDNAETVLMHILRGSGARGAANSAAVSMAFRILSLAYPGCTFSPFTVTLAAAALKFSNSNSPTSPPSIV